MDEPFSVSAQVYDVINHGLPYREQAIHRRKPCSRSVAAPGATSWSWGHFDHTRMSTGEVHGAISFVDMHHLVGRSGDTVHYDAELHRMGLLSNDDYMTMFGEPGFVAERLDDLAFMDRNRYVAFATSRRNRDHGRQGPKIHE